MSSGIDTSTEFGKAVDAAITKNYAEEVTPQFLSPGVRTEDLMAMIQKEIQTAEHGSPEVTMMLFQHLMALRQQMFALLSNLYKMMDDTVARIIGNIRS